MANANHTGRVVGIWRYPVKSMQGEERATIEVTPRGLLGDRGYALLDEVTGKVVSAKNPRRWPNLLAFHSAYLDEPRPDTELPSVQLTFSDGVSLSSDRPDVDEQCSARLGRRVRLTRTPPTAAAAEGYWPDQAWLAERDQEFEFSLPANTFFDGASVHLVTTASLDHLHTLAPTSRFDVARFRPNFVLELTGESTPFPENSWLGRTVRLGSVQFHIEGPCPRCVMTTLAQGNLPHDPHVLRTAVQNNAGNVGVYARVLQPGTVQRGDEFVCA